MHAKRRHHTCGTAEAVQAADQLARSHECARDVIFYEQGIAGYPGEPSSLEISHLFRQIALRKFRALILTLELRVVLRRLA